MQKPDATKVAGFWTWQNKFNRHVEKGESAIWIWAPIISEQCPECGNAPSYHEREYVDCSYHEESDPEEWSEGVVGFYSMRAGIVVVEEATKLSERRTQVSSEAFPDKALTSIRSAVEAVPASVFDGSTKHTEVGGFDAAIADRLSQYEYEGDAAGGYNPNCKLWSHQGFNYSVDLYDADARIAIEVEKSERKNVSDDLLKF